MVRFAAIATLTVFAWTTAGQDAIGDGAGGDLTITESAGAERTAILESLSDSPLEPYRLQLLERAMEAASSYPVRPHIKNRSRAQRSVVLACLELDQPRRAFLYAERVANWQRGECYADLALHVGQRGHPETAGRLLEMAGRIARASGLEEWRQNEIRERMIRAYAWAEGENPADEIERQIAEDSPVRAAAIRATRAGAMPFETRLAALDGAMALGEYESLKFAMDALVRLYGMHFEESDRRAEIERRWNDGAGRLLTVDRIALLIEIGESALDKGDRAGALRWADECRSQIDSVQWAARDRLPMLTAAAALRHRAGDVAGARAELDESVRLLDGGIDAVQNYERAEMLRAVAELRSVAGDGAASLETYRRAVEDGAINPNIRPRTDDLTATCVSMALHGVGPDAPLLARIDEILRGLTRP